MAARGFMREAWRLAWPYWRSEERRSATVLLAAIVGLNLFSVWLNVRFTEWNNDFYNALQEYNWPEFWRQFGVFGAIAVASILVAIYQLYLSQWLIIRWRRWITDRFLEGWLGKRAYYRLQLTEHGADNPDQRIADDLERFTRLTLDLGIGVLNSVVTLFSFLALLWGLSGSLTIPLGSWGAVTIPAYMVIAAFLYAAIGTLVTRWIGRPLVQLNFDKQRYEADFRFSLVRLRENAENVAFYGGESRELETFRQRFGHIVVNWWGIMTRRKKLTAFTSAYSQIANVFPFVVAAPRYFAKEIQLGGLMQIASAFGQVQSSLSFLISSYTEIAEYQSVVERLSGFQQRFSTLQGGQGATISQSAQPGLALDAIDIDLPDGTPLRHGIAATADPGAPLLIMGPSGSGKSTLLRAVAGLWPFARGAVRVGAGRSLFLPQRPYLPLGTLLDALLYPQPHTEIAGPEISAALEAVGLERLGPVLNEEANWAQRLSLGEQQRLAFARILLLKPETVFLDEATSALDPAGEDRLYRMLREAPWKPTIVSVGHHEALRRYHEKVLDLGASAAAAGAR